MSDAFISYRRKPSAALAQLIQLKLERDFGIDAYVDTTRTDSTRVNFPDRLMKAIEDSPTFICLLGDSTLESDWVRKEIWRAYELRKHCIPVFQESYVPSEETEEAIEYLLDFDGVHVLDVKNIFVDQTVADLAALIVRTPKKRRLSMVMGGIVTLIVVAGIIGALLLSGGDNGVNNLSSDELAQTKTREAEIAMGPTHTPTDTPINTITPTNSLTPTDTPTATITSTPTINLTATVQSLYFPNDVGLSSDNPITQNTDWTPVIANFDGIDMVLVPVGCLMMGSESGPSDERPVEEQCFSEPFWIDRTEVTQADFARLGGDQGDPPAFAGGNRPVENIDWGEARSFCESRNMRLPSEREWEYVVRGPDNLSYPWGNEWDSNNTIWNGNSGGQTANVGSIPTDVTWVGALDMIGNVREWTNTVYNQELYPYPYRKLDGRETEEYLVGYLVRVVRGGSWDLARPNIGATKRSGEQHFEADNSKGFRCASFLN